MNYTRKTFASIASFIVCVSGALVTEKQAEQAMAQARPSSNMRKTVTVSPWTWTSDKWTGDEKPYRKIRIDIEQSFKKKELNEKIVQKYKMAAERNLFDAKTQFRSSYASLLLGINTKDTAKRQKIMSGTAYPLARVSSPHTYEFSRLRFILEARAAPNPQLGGLGKRLLLHNSQDALVKFYLISVLQPGTVKGDKELSLRLLRELAKKNPKDFSLHTTRANIYFRLWLVTKQAGDAQMAIAEYKEFLKLSPPNHSFRQGAESMIKLIEALQAKQKGKHL